MRITDSDLSLWSLKCRIQAEKQMDGRCSDKRVKPSHGDGDTKKYNYKRETAGQARPGEGKAKGFPQSKPSPLRDGAEDPSSLLDACTGARARSPLGDAAASVATASGSTPEDELWATKRETSDRIF